MFFYHLSPWPALKPLILAGAFTKTLDKKDEIVYIRLSCKNYLDQGGHLLWEPIRQNKRI
jgi:hypothetical protein